MRILSRSPPVSTTSISHLESNSERSFHTNTSSVVQPAVVPKYFNIPFAIRHGYFRCVRYLLELSYDPNERDNQFHTSLILCAYIENDRWSLSLAQNLLEKRAKIALADNARRNAMHHACALQRIHLVQLYLSCLEFDIQSQDCDGNTYLHYAAVTGNCEIAELLVRIADKMNVRLDQYVNREGCSAAVLALRYGHIECANQITHRNWDEFFVIPRPLSVYENSQINEDNNNNNSDQSHNPVIAGKQKNKSRTNLRPSAPSFGLLKIVFNETDTTYTQLANLCHRDKQNQQRRARKQHSDQDKSIMSNGTQRSSVETITTEFSPRKKRDQRRLSANANEKTNDHTSGLPPRRPSSVHKRRTSKTTQLSHEKLLTRMKAPIIHIQDFDASASSESITILPDYDSSQVQTNIERPQTALLARYKTSNDVSDESSRLFTRKTQPTSVHKKAKKKSTMISRPKSASSATKPQHSNLTFESSIYSKTLYSGRPLSAALQNHHCRSPVQQIVDPSCSIREVRGVAAASRYNNPIELFGIKPEDLFGTPDSSSKCNTHRDTLLKDPTIQQKYVYQQDVDKLVNLHAIQHTPSYRPSVIHPVKQTVTKPSTKPNRRISTSKCSTNSSRASTTIKQSTLAALNITRRFTELRRPTLQIVHT
ncbi:unnamed protein product [Adineta ricciae]|uniref:Uncharacterized protein n=1 Tax=Adineta ricciae TaxID=249248 RepID=A0A816D8P5_ADIRI|nr:unnamed protein product [Adineta ricciae]CAF1631293.1 unnamed protein product [Adineta ricciae]